MKKVIVGQKYRMRAAICVSLVGLMAGIVQAGPVPITVRGVTGSNGGNWPSWLGHLTDMCNGNLSYNFSDQGVTDHNPSMNISANPYDPAAWIFTQSSYQQEWSPNSGQLLNYTTTLNQKILWAVFDFGSVIPAVDKMYIWNRRADAGTGDTAEYNIYYSSGVGINTLPAMPQSKTSRGDYDFSSGDWTLFNTGGPLILARNTANNNTFQTNLVLGGVSARYVAIEILSGGTAAPTKTPVGAGLGQVEFTINDTVAPTLNPSDITNNIGSSMEVYNPVTYTLTFSEAMRAGSVTAGVFSAGVPISVESITQTATNVFEVVVVPTATGSLALQVSSTVMDLGGLTLAANVTDDDTITVGSDGTAPIVTSIEDTLAGSVSAVGGKVRYTYTFNEHVKLSSFAAGDFQNISNAAFTVTSITYGDLNSKIVVDVTLTEAGHMKLRLKSGSVTDMSDNATGQNWDDDKTLSVLQPATVIYEPFSDSNSSLYGNTPGLGLTNTWGGATTGSIITNNQTYSKLVTSGNAVRVNGGWSYYSANINTNNALYASLLANGGEMWFSILYHVIDRRNTDGLGVDTTDTTYERFMFAISDDIGGANGGLNSGQGIGFGDSRSKAYAVVWRTSSENETGKLQGGLPPSLVGTAYGTIPRHQTVLMVGHIEWGVNDATDVDTITLYMPGTDLELGSPVSTAASIVSQSSFKVITHGTGNELTTMFDEIRVGATYDDVVVLPPPAGTIIQLK